jgi:hypothetical protein
MYVTRQQASIIHEEKNGVTVSGNSHHCFFFKKHTKPSQVYVRQMKEKLRKLKTLLSKHLYETKGMKYYLQNCFLYQFLCRQTENNLQLLLLNYSLCGHKLKQKQDVCQFHHTTCQFG